MHPLLKYAQEDIAGKLFQASLEVATGRVTHRYFRGFSTFQKGTIRA